MLRPSTANAAHRCLTQPVVGAIRRPVKGIGQRIEILLVHEIVAVERMRKSNRLVLLVLVQVDAEAVQSVTMGG
jgi:hypothetical protein